MLKLRNCWQITTFAMLNRFCLLSKKSPLPHTILSSMGYLLEDNEIESTYKLVLHCFESWRCLLEKIIRYSYQFFHFLLLYMRLITSAGISFYYLLELHSTLPEDYRHKFSFSDGFTQSPTPLTTKIHLACVTKDYCRWSLTIG